MIRQKLSDILGIAIPKGKMAAYTSILDADGSFTRKKMQDILLALCEELEEYEDKYAILENKLRTPSPEMPLKTASILDNDIVDTPVGPALNISLETGEESLYLCPDCGKSFKAKIGLAGHRRTHAVSNSKG